MRKRLRHRCAVQRQFSSFEPILNGFVRYTSFRKVKSHEARLRICKLGKQFFELGADTGVKLFSCVSQQQTIGGVADEGMLEQIARVGRRALSE